MNPRRIIFALAILASLCAAGAARIMVSWDPNPPEENVLGYKIYYGTNARVYDVVVDVGNVTNAVLEGFQGPRTYYFAATAYNSYGESDFSEEVSVTIPSPPEPPGGLWVLLSLEASTNLAGPWTNLVGWPAVRLDSTNGAAIYLRAQMGVVP